MAHRAGGGGYAGIILPVCFEAQAQLSGVPSAPTQSEPLERKTVLILKAERERQQLSAAQLAGKIGVSRAAITHIEADRSRPSFWIMLKIAGGLGLKLESVISEARKSEKP